MTTYRVDFYEYQPEIEPVKVGVAKYYHGPDSEAIANKYIKAYNSTNISPGAIYYKAEGPFLVPDEEHQGCC